MKDYKSAFYPRVHSSFGYKVQSTGMYDLCYDMVRLAVKAHALPTARIQSGDFLVRKTKYSKEESKRIPQGSSASELNRFSGRRLDGASGQGALYLGSPSGALREHAHYAQLKPAWMLNPNSAKPTPLYKPSADIWLPGKKDATRVIINDQKATLESGEQFHVYRVAGDVYTADLRVERLFTFFSQYQFGIAKHIPLSILVSAVSSASDYSAARGMADAIYDSRQYSGISGLVATSSRGDSDSGLLLGSHGDTKGSNVIALLGTSGTAVDALIPVASYSSFAELVTGLETSKS